MPTLEIKLPNGRIVQRRYGEQVSMPEIQADIDVLKAQNPAPVDPTAGMGTGELALAGIGRGMVNVGRQVGNILGITPDEALAQAREEDRPLMATTPGQIGSFVGETAALAPAAGGLVSGVGRGLGAIPRLAGMAARRPIATGAATGMAEGALEGAVLSGPEQRGSGAVTGGLLGSLGGAAIPTITQGFRRASPEARTLEGMGVDLTPGQMVPQGGFNQLEAAMQSAPLVGRAITRARERPKMQFAQSMVEQSLPPGGEIVRGDLGDMLSQVQGQFSTAYDSLKGYYARPDTAPALMKGFTRAVNNRSRAIAESEREGVKSFLADQLTTLRGKDVMSGDLLDIRSNLRSEISRLKRQQKHNEAFLIERAEDSLTKQVNRILPREAAKLNADIDTQYGKYKIAEDAIYRAGDRDFPTPYQWQQAVKKAESSKGAYARGAGRFREETKAAREVFDESVSPATGQRLATLGTVGALTGGALGAVGFNDPFAAVYGGVPLAILAGSRPGRRFAAGLTPTQETLRRFAGTFPVSPVGRGILPIMATDEEQ